MNRSNSDKDQVSPIFCIEGNIGSGKSTVLRGLQALGYICG